ncbi:hypothetical protein E2562_019961 [Oryza meyeriana var. granulata]|uniref:Uncharacterized protein n=1 Tax=Oryza meyeriana var. granulata TaxID=110450 RepID=A0A6G1CIM1_9ORYZ|nr:hypothetical protein E2562_019961 [Oryza meyeriana var. granulata]
METMQPAEHVRRRDPVTAAAVANNLRNGIGVDRSRVRLRWPGFQALLSLGGSPLLLGPTYWPSVANLEKIMTGVGKYSVARKYLISLGSNMIHTCWPQRQLQVLGAYAVFLVGAVLVLVSTFYDGVPPSVRPAAVAAARGLDGLLFGGRFAPASDADG